MTLLAVFFALLLIGVPVGFVLLGAAIFFAVDSGRMAVLGAFPSQLYTSLEIFDLLAIPLFILLGEIMSEGGLTRQLFDSATRLLRRVPRSLAYVCLVCNLFLAAILGSANAQVAVMSRVVLPEMERQGYRRNFATALTAGASLLGPIVPPSMVFIIYAVVAQVSIGDMFIAGTLPGLFLFGLIGVIVAVARAYEGDGPRSTSEAPAASRGWRGAVPILGALSVPLVIVGSILGGIVTPTESAGTAVVVAIVVTWTLFTPIPPKRLYAILVRTALNSAIVLFLIAAARVFGYILTYYQVPQATTTVLVDLSSGPISFMLLVVVVLMIIGALVEGMAAIIILVPILLPTAIGVYGIDPIVFGIVFCMTLVIGLITPPVGTVLYIASSISGVPVGTLSLALVPYVIVALVVVLAVVFFPSLATGLL